jgi:hypothetical protein
MQLQFFIWLALLAIVLFAVYRWTQRRRIASVTAWIRSFLMARYGTLPKNLYINCTEDRIWPVLATFDSKSGGTRHMLSFSCSGDAAQYRLLSEKETSRISE